MVIKHPHNTRGWIPLTLAVMMLASTWIINALMPLLSGHSEMPRDSEAALTTPELGKLPLSFEPNAGQSDPSVRYLVHAPGGLLFFTPSEVVLRLQERAGESAPSPLVSEQRESTNHERSSRGATVRMSFVGANPGSNIVAGSLQPGKVNYLIGNDPSKWYIDLPTYANITYRELYPGIDLEYVGQDGRLKGTYTVAPRTDPSAIKWRYAGVQNMWVDDEGNLQLVATNSGNGEPITLTETAPVAWQEMNGRRLMVDAHYTLARDGTVGLALGSYDPSLPLIVDPTIRYSTYLGGSNNDSANAIAVDPTGNTYVTGQTASTNFPTSSAYQPNNAGDTDVFVSKLNGTGTSLLFSTYLGGAGRDYGSGIAVGVTYFDNTIVIAGGTESTNFPVRNAFQPNNAGGSDAFVTHLSNNGATLLDSTYLGGSDADYANAITLYRVIHCCQVPDVFVTGSTFSSNFPTGSAYQPNYAGAGDAFVTHMSLSLVPSFSTYLGGSGFDAGMAIAADTQQAPYVFGTTTSTNYPTLNAYQANNAGGMDAFLTKLNAAGTSLVYSTYLGGNFSDQAGGVVVNNSGNAFVTGQTSSMNFPVVNAFQPANAGVVDAFTSKFSTTGQALIYSTYLGGSGFDSGGSIAADEGDNPYIVGTTDSTNFPIANAIQATNAGGADAFVAKFNSLGNQLTYSTYLGGTNRDDGIAVAVQTVQPGLAYIAGGTSSNNFPLATPYQPGNAGGQDAFITSFNDACESGWANYSIAQATGTIVPGTSDIGNHCDNCLTTITLPFPFALYHETHTTARISSNGYIDFRGSSGTPLNSCLPSYYFYQSSAIMPFWDDLHTTCAGCGVYTSVSGDAPNRIFNIEWRTERINNGGAANFEVRLYEGQRRLEFIYGAVAANGSTATSGIQTRSGAYHLSTQYSCNQGIINPGMLLTFTQPNCALQQTSTPAITATPTTIPATATRTSTSTPTSPPTPEPPVYCTFYQDVPSSHPDYNRIICAGCHGVMGGFPCGGTGEPCGPQNYPYFRPGVNITVTRAETARFLSRAAQFSDDPGPQIFQDVPTTHYDYAHINRMARRGLMSGFTCGSPGEPCVPPENRPYFRPNDVPVRGQFARFVSNTAGFNEPSTGQFFEDVPPSHPLYEWVQRMAVRGLMQGFPCGSSPQEPCVPPQNRPYFRPFDPMSVPRAELARIIIDTFYPGCQTVPSATPTSIPTNTPTSVPTNTSTRVTTNTPVSSATPADFNDVPPTNPFYDAIRCLAGRGIISGYQDGSFRPNNEVTRGQLAKIVSNSALYSEDPNPQIFEDVPSTNPFYEWINRLARRGHMGGYECGGPGEPCLSGKPYFRPFANATRAQTSKIVANAAVINDPIAGQAFEDVPPTHPFYLWIERLAARGVMGGYNCGGPGEPCVSGRAYFRPYNNVTRGQSAKIVANTFYPNCQGAVRP